MVDARSGRKENLEKLGDEIVLSRGLDFLDHWGNRIQVVGYHSIQFRKTLEALRSFGISIAIDDFGTGYSALGYLTRFPMDVLKIDRSFTNGIDTDRRKAGLVQAFISMGKTLGMEIVAEGVETLAQSELLQQLGCRLGQDYLFGKPVPFTSMLATLGDDRQTSNGPTGNQP